MSFNLNPPKLVNLFDPRSIKKPVSWSNDAVVANDCSA